MRVGRTLGSMIVTGLVLAGCGGDGEEVSDVGVTDAPAAVTTATTAVQPSHTTLPSGAIVTYPASWTSYGVGFSGSLELAVPDVANVSVRDAAASEYLYGPMLSDEETLEGAFAMFQFGMGGAAIGTTNVTVVDGREILVADVVSDGKAGLMAVTESGDSFASVYAESLTDSLPPDVIGLILGVLASLDR